jgi:catechol 2,3-dioxygenase-like lactoylglutathione lyase family enzyme
MIGYVTLGTNNLGRAAKFYDELLCEIGARRYLQTPSFIAWKVEPNKPGLSLNKPFDGRPATVGNGVMVALEVDSPEKVDILHQKAIELGADSEGEPGPRGEGGFYAGYFRDLDGNKLSAFYMGPRLSAVFERVEGRSEVRRRRDRTIGRKS